MRLLKHEEMEALALGASILGSGGGGSPHYNRRAAEYLLKKSGGVKLLEVAELDREEWVAPVAFMGAPMVALEKIASGKEFYVLQKMLISHLGKMPQAVMPAEIGGGNALTAVIAAALFDIPLVDADSIGRAFPELQMSTFALAGISPNPSFFSDALGNGAVLKVDKLEDLERIGRQIAVGMGSRALACLYLTQGKRLAESAVEGSVSLAIKLGSVLLQARSFQKDPVQAVIASAHGEMLAGGMLIDIDSRVESGFLKGSCQIYHSEGTLSLEYQNEFLFAVKNGEIVGETPDILMLLEEGTGLPITSADLKFGTRAVLIKLPAPPIWKTAEGIKLVGPNVFKREKRK
jgi:DUF917 family protein